ncbi:conserved hypothetical protein [Verrucomicrobia bacterium]|nr:conserved hypothetical protein [Verrucomicrobiota bacterium]
MGLTIHWRFKASGPRQKARELVAGLRQAALDLPFQSVGELVEVSGDACRADRNSPDEPVRALITDGVQWAQFDRRKLADGKTSRSAEVWPEHLIGFITDPGEGCESASFGLCRYPAFVRVSPERRIGTKLGSGWHWSQFCKTQYASNPGLGGVQNFLRCHLTLVALLDKAAACGIDLKVSDEGDFWTKRSVPALVREVGEMNENLAGLFGLLRTVVGRGVEGEIQKFTDFERLETAGLAKPEMEKLRQLFAATGAKFDAP